MPNMRDVWLQQLEKLDYPRGGSLILAESFEHAQEIVAELRGQGHRADRAGVYVRTTAVMEPSADADDVSVLKISITIVHSKDGGTPGDTDSYPRSVTPGRIDSYVRQQIEKHIPADHLCSLVVATSVDVE